MTRPKQKTGGPIWHGRRPALSNSARKEIASLLAIEPGAPENDTRLSSVYLEIQNVLAFYPGGVDAMDNGPRPGDYRMWCAELRGKILPLIRYFLTINPWFSDELNNEGLNIHSTNAGLVSVLRAIEKIEKKCAGKRGQGNPPKLAILAVIEKLIEIHEMYSSVARLPSRKSGAVTTKSEYLTCEEKFIKFVLKTGEVRIPVNLSRYIRECKKGT